MMMFNGEQRGVRRAHSPDEDSQHGGRNNNRNHFRGNDGQQSWANRGGFNQRPFHKRHRGDNYMQPMTLEDRIALLGETGSRNSDIGKLAKEIDADLISKSHDEEMVKALTTKICRCIISFPTRTGTYATLIGLLSVKHYDIACQIINILHASYPVYLESQKWQEALTIIHLLSSLVNCNVIRPTALLSQFEFMLEVTLEDNIPQSRSDYFVYTVLSSLPYVAQELATQTDTQENFDKLLSTIENYLNKRSKAHLKHVRVWQSNDSTIQMDYIDSLWVQIKNFRATGWNETFLNRPYNEKEYKDTMASSLIPTNSPTFQIPGHSDKYVYPNPRVVLRLYEDDAVEDQKSIPGSDKIERFCVENHIRAMISEITNETRTCSRHLANIYHSDQLPMKHLLIETILGDLFLIPKPPQEEIFYHSLLYELAKVFPRGPKEFDYEVILNAGIKTLYNNLNAMSVICITRFTRWLSFRLSNSEFVFPWQTWQDATSEDKSSPKSVFVRDILERCVRLSFNKKIRTLVEAHLSDLMPQESVVVYRPVFAENPKAGELEATMKRLIIQKADFKTLSEELNIRIDGVEISEDFMFKEEKLSDQLLKVDIFTAVILSIASKSLTHISSAIGKFRTVFKSMTRTPQCQVQLLQTMHSCSLLHTQLQVVLVDKLLKADLIDAKEVCNWIFSEAMKPYHNESYVWEILEATISRVRLAMEKLETQKDKPQVIEKTGGNEEIKQRSTIKDDSGDQGGNTPEHADVDMLADSEETEEEKKESAKKEREDLIAKIEDARKSYHTILAQVFRLASAVLSDRIQTSEKSNSTDDITYYWLTGRIQEIYFNNYESVQKLHEIRPILDSSEAMRTLIVNLNQ